MLFKKGKVEGEQTRLVPWMARNGVARLSFRAFFRLAAIENSPAGLANLRSIPSSCCAGRLSGALFVIAHRASDLQAHAIPAKHPPRTELWTLERRRESNG